MNDNMKQFIDSYDHMGIPKVRNYNKENNRIIIFDPKEARNDDSSQETSTNRVKK